MVHLENLTIEKLNNLAKLTNADGFGKMLRKPQSMFTNRLYLNLYLNLIQEFPLFQDLLPDAKDVYLCLSQDQKTLLSYPTSTNQKILLALLTIST